MLKKSMLVFALLALGCGGEDEGNSNKPSDKPSKEKDASTRDARGSDDTDDGEEEEDAGTGGGGEDGERQDAGPSGPVNNGKPDAIDDAGSIEVKTPDGGTVVLTPGQDGGAELVVGMGTCCAEHETAGCNNIDLMVCVCEKDVTCCTQKWGPGCALTVSQRFCQPEARECTTTLSPGCGTNWTRSCDTIGQLQCEMVLGCN